MQHSTVHYMLYVGLENIINFSNFKRAVKLHINSFQLTYAYRIP
jgi:hypothetical protein